MKLQRVALHCGVQSYNSCVICQCFMWGQGPSRCVLDIWGKQSGIECEDIICEKGSSKWSFRKNEMHSNNYDPTICQIFLDYTVTHKVGKVILISPFSLLPQHLLTG